MKGAIFTALAEMVEQEFGLETWDFMLQDSNSDGIYISTDTYEDQEFINLTLSLHKKTDIPMADINRAFGEYAFPILAASVPELTSDDMTLKEFLLTVDRVIHVEVRKLHPDASLPDFDYDDDAEDELTMHYSSSRKLCMFSEGLISGAAKHFNTDYTLDHSQCMHDGHDSCTLQLKFHGLKNAA